jgi:hypothetical protein
LNRQRHDGQFMLLKELRQVGDLARGILSVFDPIQISKRYLGPLGRLWGQPHQTGSAVKFPNSRTARTASNNAQQKQGRELNRRQQRKQRDRGLDFRDGHPVGPSAPLRSSPSSRFILTPEIRASSEMWPKFPLQINICGGIALPIALAGRSR